MQSPLILHLVLLRLCCGRGLSREVDHRMVVRCRRVSDSHHERVMALAAGHTARTV